MVNNNPYDDIIESLMIEAEYVEDDDLDDAIAIMSDFESEEAYEDD